jgi:homoserine dehydrogenase
MDSHTEVYFEASVGGGIPIIQGLNEGLSANHVQSIFGIINGTANYILTKMGMGKSYVDALREAQAQGFAEADPSLDVNGGDTLNKLAILASLSFGERIFPDEIYQEGITEITAQDIRYAQEICDHEIKLLGIAKQRENNLIQVRVHPTLIPSQHLMAAIKGVFNGIYVIGDALGPAMFYGQGAGELPTASAVVSDIIYIARSIHLQVAGRLPSVYYRPKSGQRILQVEPISELDSQYYLRFTVKNEVGVIAKISNVLGEKNISIQSVIQKGQDQKEEVHLVIITYTAKEKNVVSALEIIDRMPIVTHSTLKIRMEKIDD